MKKLALRASTLSLAVVLALGCAALPFTGASATERAASMPVTDRPEPVPVMPETPRPSTDLTLPVGNVLTPDGAAAMGPMPASLDSTPSDSYAAQVLELMNTQRSNVGAPALRWNQNIANVSQEWADHLGEATKDPYFDWNTIHRADGGGTRVSSGATWYAEIIAFNFSPQNIVDWWMGSPSHRAAMLDGRETDAGVGYVVPTSGPYQGWHLVVSNMAGYPGSHAAPAPAPSSFSDLQSGQQFLTEMNWLADKKISTGWTEPDGTKTYRPLASVNRDAMAAFMYRLVGSPAYTAPETSPFSDVSTSQQFYKEMAWLASKKISTGWTEADGTRTFHPLQPVTRDAMAAFLYRIAGSPAYSAPRTSPFLDVSTRQPFYKEIAWLSAKSISTGWTGANGNRTFQPSLTVKRDAMAAFMYRWAH